MDHLRGRQVAFNASSRGQWDAFAAHRRKVSAILGAGEAPRPTRLCVLGAGNANDLDLPALLAAHREVHLVDLDPEAPAAGAMRQGVAGHPGLRLHGGLDVTGLFDAIGAWTTRTAIGPATLAALAEWPADRVAPTMPGPFDRVASTCLLTQLIHSAYYALGGGHPQSGPVFRAIRAGHLRLLARLAGPGGAAVLVTDVVSSDTLPALATIPEADLAGLLPRLARAGNYIRGAHPAGLLAALRGDPALGPRVSRLEVAPPWRWRLHARDYLVWAMTFGVGPRRPT